MKRIICLLLCIFLLCGCATKELKSHRRIESIDNLDGRKIGVNLGWAPDYILTPRKEIQLFRYDTTSDMLLALMYKQLDAVAVESTDWTILKSATYGLSIFPDSLVTDHLKAACLEDSVYKESFEQFVEEFNQTERGKQRAEEIAGTDINYTFKHVEPTGTGDKIVVSISGVSNFPFCFAEPNGTISGFDIELFTEYANKYNYQIEFIFSTWDDSFINLRAGRVDFVTGYISNVYADEVKNFGATLVGTLAELNVYFVEIEDYENAGFNTEKIIEIYGD